MILHEPKLYRVSWQLDALVLTNSQYAGKPRPCQTLHDCVVVGKRAGGVQYSKVICQKENMTRYTDNDKKDVKKQTAVMERVMVRRRCEMRGKDVRRRRCGKISADKEAMCDC